MEQMKLVITLSGTQVQQLRDLAKQECLPVTQCAKVLILKHLAQLQHDSQQDQ